MILLGPVETMWRRMTLGAVSLLLTVLAVEVLLARFLPQQTVDHVLAGRAGMYREGDSVVTELIPGFSGRERESEFDVAVHLNSQGYRQAELDSRLPVHRIVAIGDSFTFGHGVEGEEAYPRVLERLLVRELGPEVLVVNAGVPGRWVDEYYLELRERSLTLSPELVILGLFVGNDIDGEDARTHRWTEVDARGRPLEIDIPGERVEEGYRVQHVKKARWSLPVLRHSHFAQLLFDGVRTVRQGFRPRLKDEFVFAPVYAPETEQALARVEDLLLAMRDLCREHDAGFLVLLIPTREQMDAEARARFAALDWEKPQRLLTAFFAQHGIAWLDLRPALAAAAGPEPLYFARDSHWTPRGHAVAAAAIAERILPLLQGTPRPGGRRRAPDQADPEAEPAATVRRVRVP